MFGDEQAIGSIRYQSVCLVMFDIKGFKNSKLNRPDTRKGGGTVGGTLQGQNLIQSPRQWSCTDLRSVRLELNSCGQPSPHVSWKMEAIGECHVDDSAKALAKLCAYV